MSFFTNLRADRLVTEIRSSTDPSSPATQKAVARLKEVGSGAIEAIFAALKAHDGDAAESAMRLHLAEVLDTLRWAIDTQHRTARWLPG